MALVIPVVPYQMNPSKCDHWRHCVMHAMTFEDTIPNKFDGGQVYDDWGQTNDVCLYEYSLKLASIDALYWPWNGANPHLVSIAPLMTRWWSILSLPSHGGWRGWVIGFKFSLDPPTILYYTRSTSIGGNSIHQILLNKVWASPCQFTNHIASGEIW